MAALFDKVSTQRGSTNSIMIDVRSVFKRYPVGEGEVTVLQDLSFRVERGEFISIVGPSGSGKSTLLNMITGIDRPSEGKVEVSGSQLNTMNEGQLARWRGLNVGLVFQFFQLLPALSLVDNVVLPMDFAGRYKAGERRERAMHWLDIVGLADHSSKLPGATSGGQQQRAAIARALANDPPLLLCDEPTGNLDTAASEVVFELFTQLIGEGRTIVVVTHDLDLARQIPRVITLVDGRIDRDEHENR